MASEWVGRPVAVRHLKLEFFPAPHLRIEGVAIGAGAEVKIEALDVGLGLGGLLRRECVIDWLVVERGVLSEPSVREFAELVLERAVAVPAYCQLRKLSVREVTVHVPGWRAIVANGQVDFADGNIPIMISLQIPSHDLSAQIRPGLPGVYEVEATLPRWGGVEQIRVSGKTFGRGFEVRAATGKVGGVSFHGSGRLGWERALSVVGEAKLFGTNVRQPIHGLNGRMVAMGELRGVGRFSAHGANLAELRHHLRVDADLMAANMIVDAGPGKRPLGVERFKGHVVYDAGAIHFDRIDAGLAGGALSGDVRFAEGQSLLQIALHATGIQVKEVAGAVDEGVLLTGLLDGEVAGGIDLGRLAEFPLGAALNGKFTLVKGEVGRSKLVSAVNSSIEKGGENTLEFERIGGGIRADDTGYHLNNFQLEASLYNGEGELHVDPQKQLDGMLEVDVKGTAKLVSMPLRVAGSLDAPSVFPTHGAVAGAAIGTVLLGPGFGTALGIKAGGFIGKMLGKSEPAANETPSSSPSVVKPKSAAANTHR